MGKGGFFLLSNHIVDIFYEDRECGLLLLPEITYEHIKLTSYSIMNVKLAAQVLRSTVINVLSNYEHIKLTSCSIVNMKLAAQILSSTVSNDLSNYASSHTLETAKFCLLMNTFFNIMNIRHVNSHKFDLKPSLMPFSLINDPRLSWLKNVFLQYFDDWLTVKIAFLEMQKIKSLFHNKHMRV